MEGFRRLLDLLTLGSERPLRRLIAYYIIVGAVVFILHRFLPSVTALLSDKGGLGLTDSNILEDGLAVLSDPKAIAKTAAQRTDGELGLVVTTFTVLLSTLALMLPVTWVFMSARKIRNFDQSVVQSLIILPIVVAGIVLVVRTSLALAFSLGAIVAGIRFRTNVRDVRDTVYIFLGIGVGVAAGVQSLTIAAVLSIFFNFTVLLIWRYDFGRNVLQPSASAQWSQPLQSLASNDSDEEGVPDRDLVLALTPQDAADLAKRFDRVHRILGPAKKRPKFDSVLTVTTTSLSEAQNRIEMVLPTITRRWKLDQVTTNSGKPGELYYLVGTKRSITKDQFLTAIRESAGDKIISADLEVSADEKVGSN